MHEELGLPPAPAARAAVKPGEVPAVRANRLPEPDRAALLPRGHPDRGISVNSGDLTLGNCCKVINNTNPTLNNSANGGGGIYAAPGSRLTLEDGCEISGNTVKGAFMPSPLSFASRQAL
jgi:hypothetical protein